MTTATGFQKLARVLLPLAGVVAPAMAQNPATPEKDTPKPASGYHIFEEFVRGPGCSYMVSLESQKPETKSRMVIIRVFAEKDTVEDKVLVPGDTLITPFNHERAKGDMIIMDKDGTVKYRPANTDPAYIQSLKGPVRDLQPQCLKSWNENKPH